VNKNILLKNNINRSYFKKNFYLKDKVKLNKIIKATLNSINNKKNALHILSKKFDLNFHKTAINKLKNYKSVVLIGMGGSALGAKAIYSFLRHKIKREFIFLDNLDQLKIEKIRKKNLKDFLFIIVSKSGNTLETLINTNLLKNKINKKNTIIITDKKSNLLNTFAKKNNFLQINHKDYIGGRYSVLSEVGMIPALFMNLKIKLFRKNLLNFLQLKKLFMIDSVVKLSHIFNSKKINSLIFLNYAPELNEFLYWCQQLIAESLGKKGKGLLPVISSAPSDHHSLLQLYLDGPKDKLFYIFSSKLDKQMKISPNIFGKKFSFVENKELSKVRDAQKKALIRVLQNKNIPYREFKINKANEETLGELFSYFMLETVLLGNLMGANPFDQPAVEQVKILTKEYLS